MIIVSKNKSSLVNLSFVTQIFKGSDGLAIKVNYSNGQGTQLERYQSMEATDVAMEMLCENIGKTDIYVMPTDEQVKARILATKNEGCRYHNNYKGTKAKSHGGS